MCVLAISLVTTRNQELRNYSSKDGDANVTGMHHEDAMNLILHLARAEGSDKNKALAGAIVQVLSCACSLEPFELKHDLRNCDCFALAVSQAGAYIHCHSSLSEYREFYLHERDHLLQQCTVSRPGSVRTSGICDVETELTTNSTHRQGLSCKFAQCYIM